VVSLSIYPPFFQEFNTCLTDDTQYGMLSMRKSARGAEKSAEIGLTHGTLEPDPGNAGVGIKVKPLISALHTRNGGNFYLEGFR
jgi:hypothetical protein